MSGSKRRWPRMAQGLVGYLLTLMLAVSLTGACMLTLMHRLLTDQALHERVALDDLVIDAQMTRMEEEVGALAQAYGFAPETAMAQLTRESVQAYGRDIVAWWMGLMGERPELEAPFLDTSALENAVRADELFRESTEEYMRRAVARDDVAYPIAKTLRETVMPVRVSVIGLMVPEVLERVDVPRLIRVLGDGVIGLYGLSAALLALVLMSQGRNRCIYGSVGLLAADVLLVVMTAAVFLADLPGAMAALSAALSLQLALLERALLPGVLLAEGALLLGGAVLLGLGLRRRAHSRMERTGA